MKWACGPEGAIGPAQKHSLICISPVCSEAYRLCLDEHVCISPFEKRVDLMTLSLHHSSLSHWQLTIDIAHASLVEEHGWTLCMLQNKYFADLVTQSCNIQ